MDLDKFVKENIRINCVPDNYNSECREKLNSLLSEYQAVYKSSKASKSKTSRILYVEPRIKKRRFTKLYFAIRFLTHGLYYFNTLNLLPCDSSVFLNLPPWKYEHKVPKLNIEEFLIEPDWDAFN